MISKPYNSGAWNNWNAVTDKVKLAVVYFSTDRWCASQVYQIALMATMQIS